MDKKDKELWDRALEIALSVVPTVRSERTSEHEAPVTKQPDDHRAWVWKVDAPFNPEYDAHATPDGISYNREIQGPFCGYDHVGTQSWDDFFARGARQGVDMPDDIAAEIRAFGLALRR